MAVIETGYQHFLHRKDEGRAPEKRGSKKTPTGEAKSHNCWTHVAGDITYIMEHAPPEGRCHQHNVAGRSRLFHEPFCSAKRGMDERGLRPALVDLLKLWWDMH